MLNQEYIFKLGNYESLVWCKIHCISCDTSQVTRKFIIITLKVFNTKLRIELSLSIMYF